MFKYIEKISPTRENNLRQESERMANSTKNGLYINTIDLGLSTTKAAVLLSRVINWKWETRPKRKNHYWGDNCKGGGVLVKADAHVAIDSLNNVKLVFDNPSEIFANIRSAAGLCDYIKAIKDKLANELKSMWTFQGNCDTERFTDKWILAKETQFYGNNNGSDNALNLVNGKRKSKDSWRVGHEEADEGEIKITRDEFRCVYEFLKGRNSKKSIEKYGQETYDGIIGKKIEDQFLITAIEVLKEEISKAEKEGSERLHAEEKRWQEEYNKMNKAHGAIRTQIEAEKKAKIEELTKQINDLIKNSSGIADMTNTETAAD